MEETMLEFFKPLGKDELVATPGTVRVIWGMMNPKKDEEITWFLDGDYLDLQKAIEGAHQINQGPNIVRKLFSDKGMELLPPKTDV